MVNITLVFYMLRAAARDRLVFSCIILTALAVALAVFIGDAAVVEKSQFVVVYTAGALRALMMMAIVMFTAFYVQRSYTQRDVEFLLSRPISRGAYILSHAFALFILAFILSSLALVGVSVVGWHGLNAYYLFWALSLFGEMAMMGFVTFFFAMVLSSSTVSALMALAFYVLARLSGQMLGIVNQDGVMWGKEILVPVTQAISVLIPRFDLMTQSSWLIYGPSAQESFMFLLAQTSAFSLLVLVAAVIDLKRRQF